jgi:hypothetical protein
MSADPPQTPKRPSGRPHGVVSDHWRPKPSSIDHRGSSAVTDAQTAYFNAAPEVICNHRRGNSFQVLHRPRPMNEDLTATSVTSLAVFGSEHRGLLANLADPR